jgi:hypothetical protein
MNGFMIKFLMGTFISENCIHIHTSEHLKIRASGAGLGRLSERRDWLVTYRNCMGYFRYALAFATKPFVPNYLRAYWPSHVRFASDLKSTGKISPLLNTPPSFVGLGLSKAVHVGLKSAFPGVADATQAQSELIPAIIQGKDVMIKGHTGSGKCVKSVV